MDQYGSRVTLRRRRQLIGRHLGLLGVSTVILLSRFGVTTATILVLVTVWLLALVRQGYLYRAATRLDGHAEPADEPDSGEHDTTE